MGEARKIPGKPLLPPEAEAEIMAALFANMKISSDEIVAILKRHGVSGDAEALQDSYRRRLGQRLMSSIRDERGQRELLAAGREYILVDCCNDRQKLQQINRKLQSQMQGVDQSLNKVDHRLCVLNRFLHLFGKAG